MRPNLSEFLELAATVYGTAFFKCNVAILTIPSCHEYHISYIDSRIYGSDEKEKRFIIKIFTAVKLL